MRAETRRPRGRRLPLGSRGDAMALQDVAHRLISDRLAKVGQGADDPVRAPGTILLRHADDQRRQFRSHLRASKPLALLGTVTLLGHALPVPGQDGVRFDEGGYVRQRVRAQLLAQLGQGLALAVTQPEAPLDVVA